MKYLIPIIAMLSACATGGTFQDRPIVWHIDDEMPRRPPLADMPVAHCSTSVSRFCSIQSAS